MRCCARGRSEWIARLAIVVLSAAALAPARADGEQVVAATETLDRLGTYVQQYYSRAQTIVAEERVVMQPLTRDLAWDGFARRLVFELRVEWNPDAPDTPANIIRERIAASGPALGPPDQPDCIDPRAVTPEPLLFLLPERRDKFAFSVAGSREIDGRRAVLLDYRPRVAEKPVIEWRDDCATFELPGRIRGRLWVDSETSEVLRVDEHLIGFVDIPGPPPRRGRSSPRYYTVERADNSIRYRPVRFENPDEVLMLPAQVESVTVIPNSGMPRLRVTQTYRNYRRFVTESRIVP